MANVAQYQNKLKAVLDGDFQGTDGFKFALDQGLGALNRSNSKMRGSGNVLAALTKYGTGLAMQDRGAEIDRLGRLTGQEQSYDLGERAATLGTDRLALDDRLGTGQLDLGKGRLALDDRLGTGQLDLGTKRLGLDTTRAANDFSIAGRGLDEQRRSADQTFGASMYRAGNDYELGKETNANNAQRAWWDNVNTRDANSINATNNQNRYNVDWFNANTNRGAARSSDYVNRAKMRAGGY